MGGMGIAVKDTILLASSSAPRRLMATVAGQEQKAGASYDGIVEAEASVPLLLLVSLAKAKPAARLA